MMTPAITALILDEQARQAGHFIEGIDLNAYLEKLGARAEWLTNTVADRCRGFVAFYCNDLVSRRAFITLVLVAPEDRASGLGRALVTGVLEICRQRGFTSCRLEVRQDNAAALGMYRALGFSTIEERGTTHVLELAL